ncbi:MAG: hypothetical protein MPJ24_04980 [Pirellulaceae bacterium]|nr:hypothetical protein [Pirellulaceae bacterium]
MIPNRAISNTVNEKSLENQSGACCPHSCPSVEIELGLAKVITAWQQMSSADKNILIAFSEQSRNSK